MRPQEPPISEETAELKARLRELEDTLHSIRRGDVDALVVNDDVYTLESAHAASSRLRQDVLNQMEEAVFACDVEGHIVFVNAAAERRYGMSSSDVLGRSKLEVFAEIARPDEQRSAFAAFDLSDVPTSSQETHHLFDGRQIFVESVVSTLTGAHGEVIGSLAVVRDVSDRRQGELRRDALSALSERLRDLEDVAEIGFVASSILGQTLHVSRAGYGTIDHDAETLTVLHDWTAPGIASLKGTLPLRDFGIFVESLKRNQFVVVSDARLDERTSAAALEQQGARAFVNVPLVERGRLVAVMFVNDADVRVWLPEELTFIEDVAGRTRATAERVRNAAALRESERQLRVANEKLAATVEERTRELMVTEEALRQAQKMEAVGQLTGGIAHDFNNLLAGISASLQMLQSRLRRGKLDDVDRYIGIGQDSVRRAAALTQRLLAFARRQTLDPKPTDLNRLVKGMEDLIRRSVGPSVRLEVVGAADLWPTRIDPSQLENALLNLCINGRDAMLPTGGRLTIATANRWLDERAAVEHELTPGQYVSLSVTDRGAGMTPEVIKRVFDPFFTTKPLGQGTGLGLSMVYGFMRQSDGQVRVYSEVGKGTTMALYLPRHVGIVQAELPAPDEASVFDSGGETVLLIEDEENIRVLVAELLRDAGFRVLLAHDGPSGLRVLLATTRIHMLVTDVGLPGGMNGRQVADHARIARPDLKVLFITGYAENAVVGDGHLGPGMEVMTKPFEMASLANKVRTMMGPGKSQDVAPS